MLVTCDRCNLVGRVDDGRVPDKGVFVRCPKCRNRILVGREDWIHSGQDLCPRCGRPRFSSVSREEMRGRCVECGRPIDRHHRICPRCRVRHNARPTIRNWIAEGGYFLLVFVFFIIIFNVDFKHGEPDMQIRAADRVRASGKAAGPARAAYLPLILKDILIGEMEEREIVEDANIREEPEHVILGLLVAPRCSERRARDLGEDFMRLYIALSPEEMIHGANAVGQTKYRYQIGVTGSDDRLLASGFKEQSGSRIRWQ